MPTSQITYHHRASKPVYCSTQAGGAEITIPKNRYLFVFLSNEIVRFAPSIQNYQPASGQSQGSVYIDDLTIQHTPGNLLEACPDEGGNYHYYPTGLEMFALSSSASNGHTRSRYGYQGQELESSFALNLNEFEARHYACPDKGGNYQTGRWMVPDPAQQFPSPYVGMGNHWVSGVDPDGRAWFVPIIIGAAIGGFGNLAIQHHQGNINSLSDGLLAFGKGAAVGAAVGSGVGKIAAIKAMPVHATQSAILAATKPAMAMSAATATNASVLIGGGLNVVNNYNPEQGIGLHTLGHFVAGAVGSYLGITEGGALVSLQVVV